MARPSKPSKLIQMEGRSHRTKAELATRSSNEKSLLSGMQMRERTEVKENEVADKEYKRINRILKKIEKNDALYEPIINRYCQLYAECVEMESQREEAKKEFVKHKNKLTK